MSEVVQNLVQHINGELLPTASLVQQSHRMGFLPKLFGNALHIEGQQLVYNFTDNFCSSYRGDMWEFVKITRGVGYMRPSKRALYGIRNPFNDFEGHVSGDALGIIVTLMTLSQLSFKDRTDTCAENFHSLRDFMADHPEASSIYRAID